jgi:hypothetical protein
MSWDDFTGKAYSRDDLVTRLDSLRWDDWKPSGIILHNTAAPTLAQWAESGEEHDQRLKNLRSYYEGLGWHAGPHWFVSRHWINEFMNPTTRGTHSPSFNATHFGIEMVGDYDREAFDSGDGALVRDNAVFLMAELCRRFGWDPASAIKLHKEDPRTTHDCPGRHVSKADVVASVRAAMGMKRPDGTGDDARRRMGAAIIDHAGDDARRRMAAAIIDNEARRDSAGRLQVYRLPAGDQGGTYEVAGFNDRYHPAEAAELRALIEAGRAAEAEDKVAEYILRDTAAAAAWTSDPGVEFMLRDTIHHRGKAGAAKVLQRAAGVKDDGDVGADTMAAVARIERDDLLVRLRAARESYEVATYGKREQFWRGFVNRWNKALETARSFPAVTKPVTGPTPVRVVSDLAHRVIAAMESKDTTSTAAQARSTSPTSRG